MKTLMDFFRKIKFLTENTINYDVTFGAAGAYKVHGSLDKSKFIQKNPIKTEI